MFKKIAFDIDGTIVDVVPIIRAGILKEFNFDIGESPKNYEINIPGVTRKEITKIIYMELKKNMFDTIPYDGVIDSLRKLHKFTKEPIVFLTARDENIVKDETQKWLKKHLHDIPFEVYYSKSKNKIFWVEKNGFTIFVDDLIGTANQMAQKFGVSFLVNQSWNIDKDVDHNVIRVDHISDVVQRYINSYLNAMNVKNKRLIKNRYNKW